MERECPVNRVISPVAIDLGAKNTGLLLTQYAEGGALTREHSKAVTLVMPEEGGKMTWSQQARTATRHRLRSNKRRKMAKRLLKLSVQQLLTRHDVTLTDEQNKTIQIGNETLILPLAQSRVRESDTIIRAKSGEIVIIGGLIETYKIDQESKTPLLGDIPLLGGLFQSVSETTQKRELVILLKPVVIGQDTWKTQLQDARSLLKKWFPEEDEAVDD